MSNIIYGIYEKTLFRDEKTAATYFALKVPETVKERNKYGTIVVSAHVPLYHKGTPLKVIGEWERNEKGIKLVAEKVVEETQDDMQAILYLASGVCPGIGLETATKIVTAFGKDVFDLVKDETFPERLIPYTGETLAHQLCAVIKSTGVQRELFEFVLSYGGFYNTSIKLYRSYGIHALKALKENPYIGLYYGLSFEQCDAISRDEGGHAASPERLRAAVTASLYKKLKEGHCYTDEESLMKEVQTALDKTEFSYRVPACITSSSGLNSNPYVSIEEGSNNVYLRHIREAEIKTAVEIARLMENGEELNFTENLYKYAEKEIGITYAPQQKSSFSLLRRSGVACITGGPGTGKTTTVNGLIKAYKMMYPEKTIKLCAPTGRAAQRMTESTGEESVTIHRLLEYKPFGNELLHKTASDPIEADFIIVDEVSMLDIELASIFFSAVKNGTLVLLVGDVNQLPSVGAGDVLHDIIRSKTIPVCQLTTVYRQAAESPIIGNASKINLGTHDFIIDESFGVNQVPAVDFIADEVIDLVLSHWNPDNPFETQVLCPTHKGAAGVSSLNARLQSLLNPPKAQDKAFRFGSKTFREGDKVLMQSNNYEYGYYNGDLGIVKEVTDQGLIVKILDKEILIDREVMGDISLAYAMTIHKSQGSEFKNVIISLPYKPQSMLKRNLLYTAVTRAKEKVFIIAENGAIQKSVKTVETGTRNTKLTERLKTALS